MTLMDAYEAYCVYCSDGKTAEKKGDFKEELLATLGQCAAPSNGKRNYWRGWRMKAEEEVDADEQGDDATASTPPSAAAVPAVPSAVRAAAVPAAP